MFLSYLMQTTSGHTKTGFEEWNKARSKKSTLFFMTVKHRVVHVPCIRWYANRNPNVEWKRVYVLKDNLWSKARMKNEEQQWWVKIVFKKSNKWKQTTEIDMDFPGFYSFVLTPYLSRWGRLAGVQIQIEVLHLLVSLWLHHRTTPTIRSHGCTQLHVLHRPGRDVFLLGEEVNTEAGSCLFVFLITLSQ